MPSQRALIYCRQSRERDESTSIEDQEAVARRYCADNGWTVVGVVIDRDTSGSEMPWSDRPNFPTVFDTECDVLVLYRWDRLSRLRFDQEEILKKWGALGRDMQAATEPIDASTASGDLNRGIILMFAAHQARVIGERWRETLGRRVERGLPKNGLPRWGYVKKSGAYIVHEVEGLALRDAYLRFTAGAALDTICATLNESALTTTRGGEWTRQSLGRVLDSGFGAGLIIDKQTDTFSTGAHEPVIDADEWQAYLDARARRKSVAPRQKTARWWLAGIAECGLCGGRVHGNKRQVLCGVYKQKGKDRCSGVFMLRLPFEQSVVNWIGSHIDSFPERDVTDAPGANVARDLEDALEGVQARLARLAEGWASGLLDAEGYRGAQQAALAERASIENALRHAREEAARSRPLTKDEWSRLEGDDISPAEWNALLARVLRRVEVHPGEIRIVPVVGETSIISR